MIYLCTIKILKTYWSIRWISILLKHKKIIQVCMQVNYLTVSIQKLLKFCRFDCKLNINKVFNNVSSKLISYMIVNSGKPWGWLSFLCKKSPVRSRPNPTWPLPSSYQSITRSILWTVFLRCLCGTSAVITV